LDGEAIWYLPKKIKHASNTVTVNLPCLHPSRCYRCDACDQAGEPAAEKKLDGGGKDTFITRAYLHISDSETAALFPLARAALSLSQTHRLRGSRLPLRMAGWTRGWNLARSSGMQRSLTQFVADGICQKICPSKVCRGFLGLFFGLCTLNFLKKYFFFRENGPSFWGFGCHRLIVRKLGGGGPPC